MSRIVLIGQRIPVNPHSNSITVDLHVPVSSLPDYFINSIFIYHNFIKEFDGSILPNHYSFKELQITRAHYQFANSLLPQHYFIGQDSFSKYISFADYAISNFVSEQYGSEFLDSFMPDSLTDTREIVQTVFDNDARYSFEPVYTTTQQTACSD